MTSRKKIGLFAGTIIGVALISFVAFPHVKHWYTDRYAGKLLTNIFTSSGLGADAKHNTELSREEWSNLAKLAEGPMKEASAFAATLGQDAAPGLVKVIVDRNENDWARSQAINAIRGINNRDPWIRPPTDVDYEGLMRVVADESDWGSHRDGAVDLLGIWKHQPAAPLFRRLLDDPNTPLSLTNAIKRNYGNVDQSIQALPAEVFDPAAPASERQSWLRFAASATISDTDIRRIEPLVFEKGAMSNLAIKAIGAQRSPVAADVLGDIMDEIASSSNRVVLSPNLAMKALLSFNTKESRERAEVALISAIRNQKSRLVEEWMLAIKRSNNKEADSLIAKGLEEIRKLEGEAGVARLQNWLNS